MAARKGQPAGQLSFAFDKSESKKSSKKKKVKSSKTKKAKPKKAKAKKAKSTKKVKHKAVPKRPAVRKKKKAPKKKKKSVAKSKVKSVGRRRKSAVAATAETMAAKQRAISISEFFAKNRHLLGFDNPRKALLTAVKEAVDNSLDACEEAHILPELLVSIKPVADNKFVLMVRDNGPGIVKQQIPNIFARLLYGSKFHSLKMSRGQQGIGISAAGMYGLLTTGEPVQIVSRTSPKKKAHHYHVQIDTAKNKPVIVLDEECDFELATGTSVTITLEGKYQRGRQSVDEYIAQSAVATAVLTNIPGKAKSCRLFRSR
jgi:DNA topoisomerase-6 subunit B